MSSRSSSRKRGWFAGVSLVTAFLAGCATPLPRVSEPAANVQLASPEAVRGFYFSGRIGVQYDGQGFSGTLQWRHGGPADEILILSPLGQGVARIARDAQGVTLTTSDDKVYRAQDVESLTRQVLGWGLPLQGLQYWVLGLAAPGGEAGREFGENRRLARLHQDAWRIDYLGYRSVQGISLPGKMVMANDRIEVKLVIDKWRVE
jgi:outer membrane lipoprotein LolB